MRLRIQKTLICISLLAYVLPSLAALPLYKLRSTKFIINGFSREFALASVAEIQPNMTWENSEELSTWTKDAIQRLRNQRVLDFADIQSNTENDANEDIIWVDLYIFAKDSWNIIVLPKPVISSNEGIEFSLRARDYNFLGTLHPLRINFGYTLNSEKMERLAFSEGAVFFELDSDIPFRILNQEGFFDFDHIFSWSGEGFFHYANTTGISFKIPLGIPILTFGASQGFSFNDETDEEYVELEGSYLPGWFLTSTINAALKIPLKFLPGCFSQINYIPSSSFEFGYGNVIDPGIQRRGPRFNIDQEFVIDKINWKKNFREGFGVQVINDNKYNIYTDIWESSIYATGIFHISIKDILGISSRLFFKHNFSGVDKNAARTVRGVLDRQNSATTFASINFDAPYRLPRILFSSLIKKDWIRYFDMEIHVVPFFDIALVHLKEQNTTTNSTTDLLVCTGAEIIVFPLAMRSIFLRASIGFDIFSNFSDPEVFIGLGHYY